MVTPKSILFIILIKYAIIGQYPKSEDINRYNWGETLSLTQSISARDSVTHTLQLKDIDQIMAIKKSS
jgi:hypothetical protein